MVRFRYIAVVLCSLWMLQGRAQTWTTHFAYNQVSQIAMTPELVYVVSDGSLFSVNKLSEQMKVYNRQSGLHGNGITCIHYDAQGNQLLICYGDGKMDILSSRGVKYIGELYDKDMTQRKTINNVTISGRTAYLSTAYGIQTFNLNERKLVDSYWLRPNSEETLVEDVLISGDSIYAFTTDSLFCASLNDNIVDYSYWKREMRSDRISPDPKKGKEYEDATDIWYAGSTGLVRFGKQTSQSITYKPEGPLVNSAYRMRACGDKIGVVPGGYFISRFKRPGSVMLFDNGHWLNYDASYLTAKTGVENIIDICDILFDPSDAKRFFVASFGYGLFEFRQDTLYRHYTPDNSALESVLQGHVYPYVWTDGLCWDQAGNLWMLNNSLNGIKVLKKDGTWVAISNVACANLDRSKDILISVRNPNIKLISSIRNGIGVMDDNGTIDDTSDDRAVLCTDFEDTKGDYFFIERISSFHQTPSGVLLIGTESGLFRIDNPEAMLDGNRLCGPLDLDLPEEGRLSVFAAENIQSMATDYLNRIWIGTKYSGIYCLSEDLTQIEAHFSIDNSPMLSNDVLSICWTNESHHLFVGTADGLVEYDPEGSTEGLKGGQDDTQELEEGSMLQWRLHFCYSNPTEMAASDEIIYAAAGGSLFSIDRADLSMTYWNKSTGLNGNSVSHIAYDKVSKRLVVAYEDGRIDLIDNDGDVTQMQDLYMKAGSVAVDIRCITPGSKATYLGTSFGVMAINTRKGEVADTYYIGDEASAVEVQQVVEHRDSLYVFSYNKLYKASLHDNLIDYTYWLSETMPCEEVQYAGVWRDAIYTLQHDSLYRLTGNTWQLVRPEAIQWMHIHDGKLLFYTSEGLCQLTEDGQKEGLSNLYSMNDAVYTNGEYWLAETNFGLIRLGLNGDDYFHTEGPNSNFGYCMYAMHDRIYAATGGRWAAQFVRPGRINIYDGSTWRGINEWQIASAVGTAAYDISSLGIDPQDPGHFFAASYGRGVYEFRDYVAVKHYTPANSTIREAAPGINPNLYTFVDGATMDKDGYLWVLNNTTVTDGQPLHVLSPYGQWFALPLYSGGQNQHLITPTGIWTDKRKSQYKWLMAQRSEPKLILLDDGGTPTKSSDDRCMARSSFVDQNGNVLSPAQFRCWAQDATNRIWIGTEKGILLLDAKTDYFTSNACKRIIIPRNDGTGLGDYLLANEQINCIAIDGGNRVWIGTGNSGLYLMEDDTITVAHFTEDNSMLPSNTIQSIAILPKTGEVFVGTDKGIASYRSDASEPQETMSEAYAYPNPVRPDYGGVVSIAGLMDNTVVNIVDEGGNLVCKTRSHGGTAIWDLKLSDGRRATAGVYTALCNAQGGHTVVKILVIR